MKNALGTHQRFGNPTATATARPAGGHLMIEDLDSPAEQGAALLSVCVASSPAVTSLSASIRHEG